MAEIEQTLRNKIIEIEILYMDLGKITSIPGKYSVYQKINDLVNDAVRLIDSLQKEIDNLSLEQVQNFLDSTSTKSTSISQMHQSIPEWLELASDPNLNFNEVLQILTELKKVNQMIPNTPQIIDHIENEAIYEDEQVDHFD